ncbi:sodium-coupled monocarboxylate transporter 1-like [Homarus americanus]|uniref:sodium-coupled monocarboxylate transporter 1-like n=1 Tax=Homarus americanus TaxID=6706 RepID=UPI001C493DCE|nr:sodium-coupled monocarboxylate transporter 1-like [Homarus americanus]
MKEATLVGSTMGGGTLSWLDYGVFSLMLLLSLLVGVYFAIKSRNKGNDEFLVGGRSMTCLPMSMSLVVTYLSAVSLQGFPAETFYHSMQPVLTKSSILAIPIAAAVFVPFYYELKIVSAYQYLEMRFNSVTTRRVASALFITQTLLYQAIVIYAPALALAAVTDFPMWLAILVVGAIASFYTTIGGLKAVVWTDALQFVIVLGGLMTIVIMGVNEVGSLQKVWDINVKHKRAGLQIFNWSPDIFERHTVWGLSWSGFFGSIVTYGSSQTAIQRYSSMKSLTHAYLSVLLLVPYFAAVAVLLTLTGLVLFATYEDCDPLKAGLIHSKDQILPYYVMDRFSSVPGLAGLFISCIFSGALSTISSGVNSQAAVTWEDWLSKMPSCASLSTSTQTLITKLLALVYGFLAVGLAFMAGKTGGILQAAVAVIWSVTGPLMAAFVMAIFMPFTNAKGACTAMLLGTTVALGLHIGSTAVGITPYYLPTSIEGCPADLNITTTTPKPIVRVEDLDFPKKLLGISYTLLGTLGFVVALTIGILVSVLTGCNKDQTIKRELVHKWVRWCLPDPDDCNTHFDGKKYTTHF